jgi:hypothetical protein
MACKSVTLSIWYDPFHRDQPTGRFQFKCEGDCDQTGEWCRTVVYSDPKKPDVQQYYCRCVKVKDDGTYDPKTTERPPGRTVDCGNIKLVEKKVRLEGSDEFTLELKPVCRGACDKPKVCTLKNAGEHNQPVKNPDGSFTLQIVRTYKCECEMPKDDDDDD